MTSPGLDMDQLRAHSRPRFNQTSIRDRIAAHLETHEGYLAWSAGKDSTVVLHLALQVEPNIPVAFFDGSFEFPETTAFIHRIAEQWSLNLDIIPTRHTTLQLMRACGNWDHNATEHNVPNMRRTLITDPAAIAHDRHGPGELWGVRAKESRGRRILYANDLRDEVARSCHDCCPTPAQQRETHGGITRRKDQTISYGPVWNWTSDDIWSYHARHQVPINPVYSKLASLGAPEHMMRVGQILNGDIVSTSQVTWLKRGWPSLFEELASALPRVREFV